MMPRLSDKRFLSGWQSFKCVEFVAANSAEVGAKVVLFFFVRHLAVGGWAWVIRQAVV